MKLKITYAFFFFAVFFSHLSDASKGHMTLLQIMGREEEQFHLKHQIGPLYKLNQRIVDIVGQDYQLKIHSKYQKDLEQDERPSFLFLKLILTRQRLLFNMRGEGDETNYRELFPQFFYLFINFITDIQATQKDHLALQKKIPPLKNFFFELQHLRVNKEEEYFLRNEKNILHILDKLEDFIQE